MEIDVAAVWSSWIDANDGDECVALGHLLLAVDRAGLLDKPLRS